MREKILLQLITMCKDLTGVSKQTLGVYATEMAKTVTEESQIESAVLAQKPILESIQGNLRYNEKQAVVAYQEAHPEPKLITKTPEELAAEKTKLEGQGKTSFTLEDVQALLDKKLNPLQEKLETADKAKALNTLKDAVTANIKKEYVFTPEETKRSNMAMRNVLLMNSDPENAEKLQELWEAEYNTITSDLGLSSLTPIDSGSSKPGDAPTGAAAFKASKQASGKLPKE